MEGDRVLLRSGLLLQSLNDEHDWAYRYCVLTTKDGERSLLVFERGRQDAGAHGRAGTDAAASFDAAEAQRLGSGGIVLKANDAAPETFWRALDEREAYDWRRALQANLHFDDTDQEGAGDALMPDACHGGPLLVWEIGRGGEDVRWQKKFRELGAGRGGRLRLHACEPTDVVKWRDRDRGDVLAPLATARLQQRPDAFATRRASRSRWPTGGASPVAPPTCSTTRSTPGSRSHGPALRARQPERAAAEDVEEVAAPAARTR